VKLKTAILAERLNKWRYVFTFYEIEIYPNISERKPRFEHEPGFEYHVTVPFCVRSKCAQFNAHLMRVNDSSHMSYTWIRRINTRQCYCAGFFYYFPMSLSLCHWARRPLANERCNQPGRVAASQINMNASAAPTIDRYSWYSSGVLAQLIASMQLSYWAVWLQQNIDVHSRFW